MNPRRIALLRCKCCRAPPNTSTSCSQSSPKFFAKRTTHTYGVQPSRDENFWKSEPVGRGLQLFHAESATLSFRNGYELQSSVERLARRIVAKLRQSSPSAVSPAKALECKGVQIWSSRGEWHRFQYKLSVESLLG